MPSKHLTSKQRSILRYIEQCNRTRGFPPTLREIGQEFGIRSTYGVRYHLDALERSGCLERDKGTRRGLRLAGSAARRAFAASLVGKLTAGEFSPTDETNRDATVVLDQELFGLTENADVFCLRVRGDAMIELGILAGDVAVVRRQTTANHGDIIAALLNRETTIKRLEVRDNGQLMLVPANPAYQPVAVHPADEFAIVGRVIGLLRAYDG